MPRLARTVLAKVPHHITQRGNRREDIFLTDNDNEIYLAWLTRYCQQHTVEILAYCLIRNHLHLVAVPATETALERVLKPLNMRYAQRFNREREARIMSGKGGTFRQLETHPKTQGNNGQRPLFKYNLQLEK